MKNLVILGAGTGGTIVANRIARRLPRDWSVTIVDPSEAHLYQPGLLFLPFGANDEDKMIRRRARTLDSTVNWRCDQVDTVDTAARLVKLAIGENLPYDLLVIASGSQIRPELTHGLLGDEWRKSIFDFYTLEGAQALRGRLAEWPGGRLVVNVVEMPIKCPVAPLEFLFLADDFFTRGGLRDRVELIYVTPLDKAFTRPLAAERLGHLLDEKKIRIETEFATGEVDPAARVLRSYDEREVPYDLLVTIPIHSGAEFIERAGLGNELRFVPTDPRTLAAKGLENVFVLGDATDLPSSKAGSVAHFQGELLTENLLRAMRGHTPAPTFDGHANCFVETGYGKAMLIDFNYDTEPLLGHYPVAGVGPFTLLKPTRRNHWGKLAFRWIYWNGLLKARPIPVSAQMSMAGKRPPVIVGTGS